MLLGCNDKVVNFHHCPTQPKPHSTGLHGGHVACDNKRLLLCYTFATASSLLWPPWDLDKEGALKRYMHSLSLDFSMRRLTVQKQGAGKLAFSPDFSLTSQWPFLAFFMKSSSRGPTSLLSLLFLIFGVSSCCESFFGIKEGERKGVPWDMILLFT